MKEVFDGARALALDARPAYLAAACDGDEALRQQIEALLASHDQATRFLEQPAMLVDTRVLTESLEGQCIGPITVVLNWQEELKQRVPANQR